MDQIIYKELLTLIERRRPLMFNHKIGWDDHSEEIKELSIQINTLKRLILLKFGTSTKIKINGC